MSGRPLATQRCVITPHTLGQVALLQPWASADAIFGEHERFLDPFQCSRFKFAQVRFLRVDASAFMVRPIKEEP